MRKDFGEIKHSRFVAIGWFEAKINIFSDDLFYWIYRVSRRDASRLRYSQSCRRLVMDFEFTLDRSPLSLCPFFTERKEK